MFLSRVFGRALFVAAAKSETSVAAAAAYSTNARNPLEEFFEADRKPDDDKPIIYGRNNICSVNMCLHCFFIFISYWLLLTCGSSALELINDNPMNLSSCFVNMMSGRYLLNISSWILGFFSMSCGFFLRVSLMLDHSLLVTKLVKPSFLWIKCKIVLNEFGICVTISASRIFWTLIDSSSKWKKFRHNTVYVWA